MADNSTHQEAAGWKNAFHCSRIFATFRIARQPTKIFLIVIGLLLTVSWGYSLDLVWKSTGNGIHMHELAIPGWANMEVPDSPTAGIFEAYSSLCRGHLYRMAKCVMPADGGMQLGGALGHVWAILYSTKQVLFGHPLYSLLFWPVVLLIWSICGGTVCRMASVEVARGETIPLKEALAFTRRHLFSGFYLAPVVPVLFILVFGGLLYLFGLFHSIPWAGDILGGLFFIVALGFGFLGSLLLVGLLAGGHLLWPVVATEGTTSFDAFSTSFHYLYTRPWRLGFYGLVGIVYGSICWMVVSLFAHLSLWFTRLFMGMGSIAERGEGLTKLDAVWTYPRFLGSMLSRQSELASGGDQVSALLFGMWVCLVILIAWAFLFSIYFCGSTTIYYLLRRAIDLTEYNEIEELELAPAPKSDEASPANQQSENDVPGSPEKEESSS